jgi:membrane fusion protein (multidrug efflux system)
MIKSSIYAGFFILFCLACTHSGKDEKAASGNKEKVFDAIILKADKKPMEISLPAEIRPFESAKIYSKVSGFIKSIKVDIGSIVKKGDVLAIIEAPELNAQLSESRFKRDAAKARFLSNRDTYERYKESAETAGVISMSDIEKTKNQMIADSANYSASQSYFNSIQDLNNYLQITSPFDGIVTIRNLNIGDIVGNNASKPIFELENNKVLRIRVSIPEALVGNELVSREVSFNVSAFPEQLFNAHFARKAGSIDISTRSEIWEFETNNSTHKLQAGMYAEIKLKLIRTSPSIFVPKTAIVTSLEKSFVIRLRSDITEWVDVSKGNSIADKIEIFGSLKENDIILINSNEEIKPGLRIKSKVVN